MGLKGVVEVWEGSGQDAYSAVINHLNLSMHRVETLQGNLSNAHFVKMQL